jgi:hypothetical protein
MRKNISRAHEWRFAFNDFCCRTLRRSEVLWEEGLR